MAEDGQEEIEQSSTGEQTTSVNESSVWRNIAIWLVSLLGAAGIGLQNYAAFVDFLFNVTRFTWEVVQGLAISLGGFCSTVINHCINVDLLSAFMERVCPLTADGKKKQKERETYHKKIFENTRTQFQYWCGACVFIITGILFGLTALSFSSLNALAILAITAGVFVAIIMIIQELETWLSAFDPPGRQLYVLKNLPHEWDSCYHNSFVVIQQASQDLELHYISGSGEPRILKNKQADFMTQFQEIVGEKKSVYLTVEEIVQLIIPEKSVEVSWQEKLMAWFKQRTLGHWIGTLIAAGNVLASSLFFTAALAGFLTMIGISSFPAFIVGAIIAFTIGAFTEFYFYNFFLGSFCANIDKRWQALINSDYYGFGLFTIAVNGVVNGAVGYAGVLLLEPLFMAVGLAAPPLALAIVAGVFAGLASLFLGSDFWIRNWRGIIDAMGNAWNWIWNDKPKPQTPKLITEKVTPTAATSLHSKEDATECSPHSASPKTPEQPSRSCLSLLICK